MKHILLGQKRRAKRMRFKVRGTALKPRLSVYRSSESIYAQLIDDEKHVTVMGFGEKHVETAKGTKTEVSRALGKHVAKMALTQKIKTVVFDKGGYKYHGRVKALAEGAREGGLEF